MPNLPAIDPAAADSRQKPLFDAVQRQFGAVPNIFRTLGNSPAALQAFLDFLGGLSQGELNAAQREQIALACAATNQCDYCAAAHSALGRGAGLDQAEIDKNLAGRASDPASAALISFTRQVVQERGHIDAAQVDALRAAGFSNAAVVEAIANIAANLFTNYFNHIADTEVDFPKARLAAA